MLHLFVTLVMLSCWSEIFQGHKVLASIDFIYSSLENAVDGPTALPRANLSAVTDVHMHVYLISVKDFDDISGELSLIVNLELDWYDDRWSGWDPDVYLGGKASFVYNNRELWTPSLLVLNPAKYIQDLSTTSPTIRVFSNSTFQWSIIAVIKASCSVDVSNFPFDTQTCSIVIAPWGYTKDEVDINGAFGATGEKVVIPNSAWDLKQAQLEFRTVKKTSVVVITLTLYRQASYFVVNALIPTVLLGLLNPFVFMLPASSGERIAFSGTCFLAFCVFLNLLTDNIPQNSFPMPQISVFISTMVIFSACIVFVTVLTLKLYNKSEDGQPVYRWLRALVKLVRLHYCRKSNVRSIHISQTSTNPVDATGTVNPLSDIRHISSSTHSLQGSRRSDSECTRRRSSSTLAGSEQDSPSGEVRMNTSQMPGIREIYMISSPDRMDRSGSQSGNPLITDPRNDNFLSSSPSLDQEAAFLGDANRMTNSETEGPHDHGRKDSCMYKDNRNLDSLDQKKRRTPTPELQKDDSGKRHNVTCSAPDKDHEDVPRTQSPTVPTLKDHPDDCKYKITRDRFFSITPADNIDDDDDADIDWRIVGHTFDLLCFVTFMVWLVVSLTSSLMASSFSSIGL